MNPSDIINREFSGALFGYDREEVDTFLDDVASALSEAERERDELKNAMEYLMKELEKSGTQKKKQKEPERALTAQAGSPRKTNPRDAEEKRSVKNPEKKKEKASESETEKHKKETSSDVQKKKNGQKKKKKGAVRDGIKGGLTEAERPRAEKETISETDAAFSRQWKRSSSPAERPLETLASERRERFRAGHSVPGFLSGGRDAELRPGDEPTENPAETDEIRAEASNGTEAVRETDALNVTENTEETAAQEAPAGDNPAEDVSAASIGSEAADETAEEEQTAESRQEEGEA